MATYVRVPGKERNYVNTDTGQVISRRQYLKQKRGGLSNETYARINATNDKLEQVSRPARGRSSLLKKTETEKNFIAQARIEDQLKKLEIAQKNKEERALERVKQRKANKKTKIYKDISRTLQPGKKGRRVAFDTYDEYVAYFNDAKRSGKIRFYALGVEGYHENDGRTLTATVFTMRTFDKPIPEPIFEAEMDNAIEEWSYFVFTNYWMHLAFAIEYAAKRRETAKARKRRK